MKKAIVCFVIVGLVQPAFASTLSSFAESALNVVPPHNSASYGGIIGDQTVTNPTWQLAQWSNPQPIGGSRRFTADQTSWTVTSGSDPATNAATVFYYSPYNGYGLTQNIQTTNASKPNYLSCSKETDLFLSPNGRYNTYGTSTPAARNMGYSAPVGTLTMLNVQFSLSVASESVSTAACSSSYVYYVYGLTLNNTSNGQALFYQILIRDSRGFDNIAGQVGCPGYPSGNPATFCVTTTTSFLFGNTMQSANGQAVQSVWNLLPGLVAYIKQGQVGMDPNPNNWIVTGMYMGQGGIGDFLAGSSWNLAALNAG